MQTLFALVIDILQGIMQMPLLKNLEFPNHHTPQGCEREEVSE